MNANDYSLAAEAHQKINERLSRAAEAKVASRSRTGSPAPRPRHAIARGLRRVADALDN